MLSSKLSTMPIDVRPLDDYLAGEYTWLLILNFLCTGMDLLSPYLVSHIIEYIETKDREVDPPPMEVGLTYVGILVLS